TRCSPTSIRNKVQPVNEMKARTAFACALAALLAPGGATSHAQDAADAPASVRHQIELVLDARVSSLLSEKNEDGNFYKRGSWSRQLHKVDESTYQVAFLLDTAGPEMLETRRSLLTLQTAPDGAWKITREDLQDTWQGLVRTSAGNEEFCSFDSLTLRREGMMLDATKGSLYKQSP